MRKIVNLVVITVFSFMLFSCNDDNEPSSSVVIDAQVELTISNDKGIDLLSPTSGKYSDIQYYMIDENNNKINLGDLSPEKYEGKYHLSFGVFGTETKPRHLRSFLQLDKNDIDTIDVKLDDNIFVIEKLWYNGQIKDNRFYFNVVK